MKNGIKYTGPFQFRNTIKKVKRKPRYGGVKVAGTITPTPEPISEVKIIVCNNTQEDIILANSKVFSDTQMEYFVVVDFEATCSSDNSMPKEEFEIIEFGAVLLDKSSYYNISSFSKFVKPQVHPVLSQYCRELTTITQEDIDSADSFPRVLEDFNTWCRSFPGRKTFCSWGAYDKNQLIRDCARHKVKYPFDDEHINVKELFSDKKNYKRRYGLKPALKKLKVEFIGTQHRALDDAKNVTNILKILLTEPSWPDQE